MRSLIFGPMPPGARPQSHIAAGPWCFAGRETDFPGWDGGGLSGAGSGPDVFPLPPDPFADADELDRAARSANATARRLALEEAARLERNALETPARQRPNPAAPLDEPRPDSPPAGPGPVGPGPDAARLLLLGPYFLLAAHALIERQKRLSDLIRLYGKEELLVPVPPPGPGPSFRDIQDFLLNGVLCPAFNHHIYSRMLAAMAPPAWRLEPAAHTKPGASPPNPRQGVAPPAPPSANHVLRISPKLREFLEIPAAGPLPRPRVLLRQLAARLLRDLPFPRYKGFSLPQALLLSLAALFNKRQRPDAALDFSLYCGPEPDWLFDAEGLMRDCLPHSLRQAPLPGPRAGRAARPGPLRGMTPAFMQDDAYRLRLARLLARGRRLFSVQHGANYGNLKSVGVLPFEYSRHVFFTWGWSVHQNVPANARPMPHPLLLKIADKHQEAEPALILVGTEMSSLSYRLKSRPQAGGLPAYRRAKLRFLHAARQGLDEAGHPEALVLYRPYPAAAGAMLEDGPYVSRHLPGIPLCAGDLTQRMLGCRLLVLDHYGTTLHMALAANVPFIAYWDKHAWAMEEESEKTLDILREAGMLFDGPEQAASRALALWPDAAAWWRSAQRQKARNAWLERYATIRDEKGAVLSMAQLTRRWWDALRNA